MTDWSKIQFPKIKNIQPKLLADDTEGIPTEEMPKRMAEMYANVHKTAIETMKKRIEENEGVEGKEEYVAYLKDLLEKWNKDK